MTVLNYFIRLYIPLLSVFVWATALGQEPNLDSSPDGSYSSDLGFEETDASIWSRFTFSGYLKNETAYRIREPRSITKIKNIAYLNIQYPVSDSILFNYSGWAYYDHAYDLFNYETIAARLERNDEEPLAFVQNLPREKDSPAYMTRELYVDIASDNWDARIGKQYIVWGVFEGIRIIDEINPIDFRELITPDLIDSRIPLWSTKIDYYSGIGDFQLLLIPELRFHKPAPEGSEWELLQNVPGSREPESWRLENTEIGMKWDFMLLDTELSLSYFYTWDDFPVIFRTVEIGGRDPEFYPTYTRIPMYGITGVKQINSFILKAEFAYIEDKFFGRSNTADIDLDGYVDTNGEAQKNHIRWGIGTDFAVLGWDVAVGAMQWVILDYEENLIQDKRDTSYNVFVRKEFPRHSMTFQMLYIYFETLNEVYIKPKMFLQVTNRFQIAMGMDLFDGEKSDFGSSAVDAVGDFQVDIQRAQFIGNFSNNDRVFFEFKYSF